MLLSFGLHFGIQSLWSFAFLCWNVSSLYWQLLFWMSIWVWND